MKAGNLDRLVQFRRAELVDDDYTTALRWDEVTPENDNHGSPIWASKADVSDAERWRAGEVAASITTRFVVRWSAFSRDLTPKDRLVCEGLEYNITGIKEGKGRRQWLEITAAARTDRGS